MNDPLADFRRQQSTPQQMTQKPQITKEEYKASKPGTTKNSPVLKIQQVTKPWNYPDWRWYLTLECDEAGTWFAIIYQFMKVEVKGRNLTAIIDSIAQHNCGSICDFNPNQHSPVTDPKEPVIISIDITISDGKKVKP